MRGKVTKLLRGLIPDRLKEFVAYSEEVEHGTLSFSQFGEDLLLRNFFLGKEDGIYVDVGAHDPIRYSNTYLFYKLGWSGVAIDPVPGFKKRYESVRPRDYVLEVGVSDVEGELDYFSFEEPLLNTFSRVQADGVDKSVYPARDTTKVKVRRLDAILKASPFYNRTVDILSIDAEGFDLNVLRSNDWEKTRPAVVLVESMSVFPAQSANNEIVRFMENKGYNLVCVTTSALVFRVTA